MDSEMLAALPKGRIWPRTLSGGWGGLLTGLGCEPERIDIMSRKVLDEMDPRTADDMQADWEIAYGLPFTHGPILQFVPAMQRVWSSPIAGAGRQLDFEIYEIYGWGP